MTIKVLGSGCMNCKTLEQRTRDALRDLKIEAIVEKVEAYQQIAAYGVMRTPALVIDEKVAIAGVVPTIEKLKELLLAHQSGQ